MLLNFSGFQSQKEAFRVLGKIAARLSSYTFFYNFAHWRKRLGIKANIEMFFLPDEMFMANKKTIRIHFSTPFSYELFDSSKSHKGWADMVYKFIYSPGFLKGQTFEQFINENK